MKRPSLRSKEDLSVSANKSSGLEHFFLLTVFKGRSNSSTGASVLISQDVLLSSTHLRSIALHFSCHIAIMFGV
jgi:hypothetical protein